MTKVSNTGYKKDSKDKNEKSLIIPSNHITMAGVPHMVIGIDDLGNQKIMYPGNNDYIFPGSKVQEFPIKEKGGAMKKPDNKGFKSLPKKVQETILDHMVKQFGGENLARPIWTMQDGGNYMNDDLYSVAGYIPANNPYLQNGGAYIPPSNAQKVTNVSNDFTFSGAQGNKQYFVKNMQAPGAISGTSGSNANPEAHSQFLIKQLQSGVKPEDLVKAGHATSAGIQPLAGYYKPAAVFIEPPVNTPKQPIPLNESDRVEMKQMFPPSGNKYLTFQVPDPNAGYTNPTEKYYDPQTYRPIDPLKSFDDKGNYSPSFLYTDPTQDTLSAKFRGTKIATRYDTNKIGQPDQLNVNPDILGSNGKGYKLGGPLSKFVSNYEKQFGGSHGNEKLQGQSMDEFLQKRTTDFVDYLANNAKHFIYKDEAKNFMQLGGPKVQLDDPNNPLQPRISNDFYNNQSGPFGPYGQNSGVPSYVPGITDQYNLPSYTPQPANPYQFGMTQNGVDPNQAAYDLDMQKRLAETAGGNNKQPIFSNNNIADLGMMGAQTINGFFNKAQSYKQEQLLKQKQSISNTSPATYGNKGFYDVNQGNIKPNQMTPSFKKGGSYELDKSAIDKLIAQGYEIEFLD